RQSHPIRRIVQNTNDAGAYSLRERIVAACPADTIAFSGVLAGDTIRLVGQEIMLSKHLVISGLGIDLLSISGEMNGRIFHVAPETNVQIYGLELQKGSAPVDGGAILNQGNLSLWQVRLKNNMENSTPHGLTNSGALAIKDVVIIEQDNED
ncbi:MAG: hypothetical protein R3330_02760, partial [Saprospiraceae bacterium]|nr:hypothetical protein [Saprospiraceae bacterium]